MADVKNLPQQQELELQEPEQQESVQRDIYQEAFVLFSRNPDWVAFYREVLGPAGIIRKHYPNQDALAVFEQTEAHSQIQQMLTKLRELGNPDPKTGEPTRVITVRLPKSLHDALRIEAHEHRTSMNKLCISKLLQLINEELIPGEL